jgi:hypothetical protein
MLDVLLDAGVQWTLNHFVQSPRNGAEDITNTELAEAVVQLAEQVETNRRAQRRLNWLLLLVALGTAACAIYALMR